MKLTVASVRRLVCSGRIHVREMAGDETLSSQLAQNSSGSGSEGCPGCSEREKEAPWAWVTQHRAEGVTNRGRATLCTDSS